MELGITGTLAIAASTLLYLFYRNRKWRTSYFKRLGIDGPAPHWLYGNITVFRNPNKMAKDIIIDWTKKYGKMFGYYEGPRPILVTSDPAFVQEVFIRNFSSFYGRKLLAFQSPSELKTGSIVIAGGPRWKRLRSIINPTFSAVKLRSMLPMMKKKVSILEENLLEASNNNKEPVNIRTYYEKLTLAVIGDAAFGMPVDPQNNPNEPYLKACRSMFDNLNPNKKPFPIRAIEIVPELRSLVWVLLKFLIKRSPMKAPQEWIHKHMSGVVDDRRNKGIRRPDLLQLLLDSEVHETVDDSQFIMTMDNEDKDEQKSKHDDKAYPSGPVKVVKKLTDTEIKAQSFIFLIAGFETTSTTLAYATYLLTMNPDKQHKLIAEIDEKQPVGSEISYESIKSMDYLHMVLCETLRLYPVAARAVNRQCWKTCTVNGMEIEEGTVVHVDVWSIHYSKEIWGSDAEQFVPERFTKDEIKNRHPCAWLPFGAGPKNCVGQRFGLMEIKAALIHLLRKYTFEQCAQTEKKLTLCDRIVVVPLNGVTIKLIPRD